MLNTTTAMHCTSSDLWEGRLGNYGYSKSSFLEQATLIITILEEIIRSGN